jgi:hypothetical protein
MPRNNAEEALPPGSNRVRVGFWDALSPSLSGRQIVRKLVWPHRWTHGNFGDLLALDLARYFYPAYEPEVHSDGPRILPAGTYAAEARSGDVLAGVGLRSHHLRRPIPDDVLVWGLRGPHSLSGIQEVLGSSVQPRFLGDPGLLANKIWPTEPTEKPRGWVVIPHYRDLRRIRKELRHFKSLTLVSPDQPPSTVARLIRTSEGVISSSLHGLIFAHSYGRPAVAFGPPLFEGLFKYQDYADSIGWGLDWATSLEEAVKLASICRVPQVEETRRSIDFPPIETLAERFISR